MKSKIYLFILLAALLCSSDLIALAVSPPIAIKGTVKGDDGDPIPGVSVALKGTKIVVVTDGDGNYRMSVPDGKGTLVFSHVSYQRLEVPINGKVTINVELKAKKGDLDEVVVVGYGTQKQRDVTGSIGSMKSTEIERYNVNSFQTALQGQIAGLDMSESSGVPGAAVNVRIRGLSSINGNSAPLYIIDGNPVLTGNGGDGDDPVTNGPNTGTHSNPLADINPNDIESIEVLKDAAATSIYGARGGAGVILITTKRGKAGQTSFNFSVNNGYSQVAKEVELLNGPQLLSILDESQRNTFYSNPLNAGLPTPETVLPGLTGLNRGMADTTNVNHLHDVLRMGIFTDVNLSATNGTDKTKYYINGNYRGTIATIRGTDMFQYSLRANIDHDLSKYIKVGVSLSPSYNLTNRLGSGTASAIGGYGGALVSNLPIYKVYNDDGTYFNPWTNPVAYRDRSLYSSKQTRIQFPLSAYFEARLLPSLTFRTMAQRSDWDQKAPTYLSSVLRLRDTNASDTSPFPDDQLAQQILQNSFGYSNAIQSFFTFKKRYGKDHNVEGTTGMNFSEANQFYEAMVGQNFAGSNFIYPSQGANIQNTFQTAAADDRNANLSYFIRGNYQYKKRYITSLTVNREGSSKFGGNKRFGTFPAVSLGWIVSDEGFLKKSNFISFLKIRASAGLTGNSSGIANTAANDTWGLPPNGASYLGLPWIQPSLPANLQLQWEKGTKYDAGIDATFLKGRVSTTLDLYHYTTTKMLLSIPVPLTFGYGHTSTEPSFIENRGALQNKGIEFSITSNNLTGAFKWRTTFNITHNVTKILDLGGLTPEVVAGGGGAVRLYEGRNGPVYSLIEWAGVDAATGGELVRNEAGIAVLANSLTTDQLQNLRKPQYDKSPMPKFFGGFGNTFQYKSFELSAFFSYRYGNYLLDAGERQRSYVGNYSISNYSNSSDGPNGTAGATTVNLGNLPVIILNRWTTPGQETDIPKLFYNDPTNDKLRGINTTRFLYDASYIRLKNVQLNYVLPKKTVARLGLKSAKVNVTGQNLLLFTKFPGADPEAITITNGTANYRERNIAFGIIQNVVPLPKMLTFGLNVGF
ncbi:SusC/RagA family TonB-linked outer membrane protein [Pedobacter sp. MC2016-14]|uniref:SusC/RagA family TonB-linked outer membrane protein n=1 Tax=Pedobacter sp. MC2016-14 TaxID=2897327 RepID=UPI001E52D95A|nr:SusC/RagA family TonB-linked outer membrane protein [Pedobacter sp. MC2016-14]MCD0490341.1 SusC/RagA family TonB-linked outer membrane protein [Pedobacter sp. MC2016-14]